MSAMRKGRRPRRLAPYKTKRFGSTIPNPLYSTIFPRENKVTLRYYEALTFTLAAATATDYRYNLNSIFDPYYAAGGHQPQGHDQWANFYNRYRVDGCRVTVNFCNNGSGSGYCITILGSNSTISITDPANGVESPLSVSKTHCIGGNSTVLTKNYNLADLTGVHRDVYNADDRYGSLFGANPSETLILHVIVSDLAGAAVSASFNIILEYDVTMFDPIQLTIS